MQKAMDTRYQFQPWYVKLWRRRYQLLIPYEFAHYVLTGWGDEDYSWRFGWSIAVGMSHVRMDWTYTWEEAFGKRE